VGSNAPPLIGTCGLADRDAGSPQERPLGLFRSPVNAMRGDA